MPWGVSSMEHLAIMRKSWGLTQKILSGHKKIESRWYSIKCKPWNIIKEGDTVYFKDSGEPVRLKTGVKKVLQFENLTPKGVREILNKHGNGIGLEKEKIPEFFERIKNKKYCILIFLKSPQEIELFEIDKMGFGAMSAWITVDDIQKLRLKKHGK